MLNEDFNEQCLQETPVIEQPEPVLEYVAKKPPTGFVLNETAVKIALKIIKLSEGCCLRAYPDVGSELSKALSAHNMLNAYKLGKAQIPEGWENLSGLPWSAMYGETEGIKEGDVFTQQEADTRLDKRVRGFMQGMYKITPKLFSESPEKQAAITSLVYNIGLGAYTKYAISKAVEAQDHLLVVSKLKQYVLVNGVSNDGLLARRNREAELYLSVSC